MLANICFHRKGDKMTKQWQFPAWEDMQEIDITRPLVTRGGEVVTASDRKPHAPWVKKYVYVYRHPVVGSTTVTHMGRQFVDRISSDYDVQNPPEWAYAQFEIVSKSHDGATADSKGIPSEAVEQCDEDKPQSPAWATAPVKDLKYLSLVTELAKEPCPGTYTSIAGQRKTCGRCPTCRCRDLLGVTEIPQTVTVCNACGLQGRSE